MIDVYIHQAQAIDTETKYADVVLSVSSFVYIILMSHFSMAPSVGWNTLWVKNCTNIDSQKKCCFDWFYLCVFKKVVARVRL